MSAPILTTAEAAFARVLCRRSVLGLARETIPGYQAGWVHRVVAGQLEEFSRAIVRGESPRLVLTMPPRHGKSALAERFATWHLGHNPSHEIIFASYAKDPASDRTRAARECALDAVTQAAFPALQLSDDTHGKVNWRLRREHGGGAVQAVGVRGALTSKGAHALIIDDPVKDWEESLSALKRERAWDWYQSTAYTRLAPGAGVLLIMTRWHEDDLAGRVLAETADEGWRVINFPAIADHDEAHRKAGEALHPERYDLDALERIRRAVGSHKWRALYQQQPSTPGGSVWLRDWWRFWSDNPRGDERRRPSRFDEVVTSWDLTFGSTSASASYVVGQVWGRLGQDAFLLDERRGRWGFPQTLAQIQALAKEYPQARRHLIEDKANGPAVLDTLKGKIRGLVAVRPDGSKVARAHAVSARIEAGHVYLPAPSQAPWVRDFLDECAAFPEGANDDRVDCASQALRAFAKPRTVRVGVIGGRR